MDSVKTPTVESDFDALIQNELERGINFVTIVGGEPTLRLDRLKKIYDNFKMNVSTNGIIKIPKNGFENMPIGVSVWGNHETDSNLRSNGKRDLFSIALGNYKNDSRAFWYYTISAGNAHEIEQVVDQCVANGNRVLFNFYSDISHLGSAMDHRQGFDKVQEEINKVIARHPEYIYLSSYLTKVISTGELYDQNWGYDVCTTVSTDNPVNAARLKNGNPFSPYFRAYNADFKTTRRCCVGIERSCDSCFDVWNHFSWVMVNMKKHLGSKQEFTNWLTTMYLFYLINRLVDYNTGIQYLPEIHNRVGVEKKNKIVKIGDQNYIYN
jgi:MoaA/NifB/PqqE/SkfB family radical SAM enzyme